MWFTFVTGRRFIHRLLPLAPRGTTVGEGFGREPSNSTGRTPTCASASFAGCCTRIPMFEGIRWCKMLSRDALRKAEAYQKIRRSRFFAVFNGFFLRRGAGGRRKMALAASRLRQIAPINFGFRVK